MKFTLLLALFSTLCNVCFGQYDPVKWSFGSEKTGDNEYLINITADIEKGWYVYSQYLESADGPVATSFVFENGEKVTLVGKTEETGTKHEGFDALFNMNIIKFSGKPVFKQKVKAQQGSKVEGYLTFMTCDDEKCLPPKDVSFSIVLK
jgi:hypothetical protein